MKKPYSVCRLQAARLSAGKPHGFPTISAGSPKGAPVFLFGRTFLCLRRAAVIILQFKYLPRDWDANRKTVTDSISMCMTTLINAAAIVGFGAVVQNCPGYAIAVEKILSYEGSPLMITFVATNLIAGIAGSSSAGLVLAAPVLQQAAAMTNAAVFHRTTVLASLGLDSLPNAGFLQTECTVAGVKFKDVYFPVIFALTVVLTILRCLLYMGLAAAFGLT